MEVKPYHTDLDKVEPEIRNLAQKSIVIRDAIRNKTLTSILLKDYMDDFEALDIELYRRVVSLWNGYNFIIYTDDDIDLMYLEFKLPYC